MSRAFRRPAAAAELVLPAGPLPDLARRLRALADACDAWSQPASSAIDVGREPLGGAEIARRIRAYLAARRRRDALLGSGWFADPAWDILLDLLACRHEGREITVSSACIAAAVPATTALRWLGMLAEAGAIVRRHDPQDGRRAYVAIEPALAQRLDAWVEASLTCS